MTQKFIAAILSLAILLSTSTPALASSQNIKVKQKITKHGISQKITIKQLGDLNQALADAAINAFIPNNSKNFKIKQKVKIKQKGDNNQATANPSIIATLGNAVKNLKITQKIKVHQKGNHNQASSNPSISIN